MQFIYRGNMKDGQATAYVDWVRENEKLIADNTPEGWTYLGTWLTVYGFGMHDVEVRFELDDYAALGAGFGNDTYQRLLRESQAFMEPGSNGTLMKSASDVAVLD